MAVSLIGTSIYQWNERKTKNISSVGSVNPVEFYEEIPNEFQETFGAKLSSCMIEDGENEQGKTRAYPEKP